MYAWITTVGQYQFSSSTFTAREDERTGKQAVKCVDSESLYYKQIDKWVRPTADRETRPRPSQIMADSVFEIL